MDPLYGDVFRCVYLFDMLLYCYITYSGITSHHMLSYDHLVCVKMAKNIFFFNGFKSGILKQPLGLIYYEYVDFNKVLRSGLFNPMAISYAYVVCLIDRYP